MEEKIERKVLAFTETYLVALHVGNTERCLSSEKYRHTLFTVSPMQFFFSRLHTVTHIQFVIYENDLGY